MRLTDSVLAGPSDERTELPHEPGPFGPWLVAAAGSGIRSADG